MGPGSYQKAWSTEPGSELRRATTFRNVALAVLGAVVLVLKPGCSGPFGDVLNAYAGNVAVSFALFFAALDATARYGRSMVIAAALTLLAVQLFEAAKGSVRRRTSMTLPTSSPMRPGSALP